MKEGETLNAKRKTWKQDPEATSNDHCPILELRMRFSIESPVLGISYWLLLLP